MPDFDIDFCQDRRDEVIAYVRENYGADRVAQIITFGKLQAARGAARRRPRAADALWPGRPPVQARAAQSGEPGHARPGHRRRAAAAGGARPRSRSWPSCSTSAQQLEGLYRHASTHAAGVVIGDRPLIELVPLYRDPRSDMPVTQFNMKWVEAAGLVKFDFLGLEDADRDRDRARAARRASGVDARSGAAARSTTPRPTSCSPAATRSACSSSKVPACATRCAS